MRTQVIYRAVSNGFRENEWTPVYRSEIVDSSGIGQQNAVQFEQAAIWAQHLYGSDENRALRLEVFHYASSGAHVSVGFTETSASALKYAKPGGKLYMTPTQGGRLKAAHVLLRMVKVGLCSRGGEMSSVFCLQADAFSWRRKDESEELDMYLDRDVFGRTRVEFMSDREAQYFPRGVSYMSSRCHKLMDEEEEDLGIEQSNFDESDRDYYRDQLSISDEMWSCFFFVCLSVRLYKCICCCWERCYTIDKICKNVWIVVRLYRVVCTYDVPSAARSQGFIHLL